jgi:bifunctional non-homologous end joining protein LigD
VHELKLDGFRMGVLVAGRGERREVMVISRNGTDYTAAFPEIVEAAMELRATAAVLDGEVVVLDERGRSSFQRLQQLGTSRRGLAFFAFDLLALDGEDLKPLPLEERKRRLETLVGGRAGIIRYSPHFEGTAGRCSPTPAGSVRRGSSASAARRPTGRVALGRLAEDEMR